MNTESALRLASWKMGRELHGRHAAGGTAKVLVGEETVVKVRSLCTGFLNRDEL